MVSAADSTCLDSPTDLESLGLPIKYSFNAWNSFSELLMALLILKKQNFSLVISSSGYSLSSSIARQTAMIMDRAPFSHTGSSLDSMGQITLIKSFKSSYSSSYIFCFSTFTTVISSRRTAYALPLYSYHTSP